MKKLFFLALICIGKESIGQDCKNIYFLQNNKTVEMTIYNKKGKESGKQVYTVSNLSTNANSASSTVNSEMFDDKGKSIAKASSKIQCTGGIVMMDMKMFIPSQQMAQMKNTEATASGAFLEYPANLKVGDKLKDAQFNMDINNNGMATNLDMNMTERTVQSKESVTSPAGTWEAFKITYKSRIKMKIAGIGIPVNMECTEWYVPDFGTVKSETKHGSTLITAIR